MADGNCWWQQCACAVVVCMCAAVCIAAGVCVALVQWCVLVMS
jgi:hypothetical protein